MDYKDWTMVGLWIFLGLLYILARVMEKMSEKLRESRHNQKR